MNRYALIVGVNDYADVENIQPLRFAVQDARQVDRFFHACDFEVQSLMDSEATCAAIERHLREISGRLQADDVFLFYFSGHGYQWGPPGEERQYLLPRDADLWALKHGGGGRVVPMRLVQECSRDRGARRVLILDACRSGVDPHEKGQTTNQLASKDIQAVTATSPTSSPLIVVCSCQPRQRSYEHGGLRGGLFTAAMLGEFSRLRTGGRPIRFTTETNSAISQRMKQLAVEIKMTPPEIGDFWIEGDATGVELVPACRVQSAPETPRPSAPDPEKEEVKEWVVEELHVELERVEAEQPAAPTDLPPLPESLTALRAELAGLEKTLARLKAQDHPSLQQAQAAVREAELQLRTFQEDLGAHELPLPDKVREKLAKALEANPSAHASTFCELAPDVAPTDLLPFVARLRNVHRARQALDSVRRDLNTAIEEKITEIQNQGAKMRERLQSQEEGDLNCVLSSLWPSLRGVDLVESWSNLAPQLAARGYSWDSRTLLKKVESFLDRPEHVIREAKELMRKGMFDMATERVKAAQSIYREHAGLARLGEQIKREWHDSNVRFALAISGAVVAVLVALVVIFAAEQSARQRHNERALVSVERIQAMIETGDYKEAMIDARAASEHFFNTPSASELDRLYSASLDRGGEMSIERIQAMIEAENYKEAVEDASTAIAHFCSTPKEGELRRLHKTATTRLFANGPPTIVVDIAEGVDLEMVWIPPGDFMMGSMESDEDRFGDEVPQHRVRITQPFYLGVYPVTQAQWASVMGTNPSLFSKGGWDRDLASGLSTDDFPVERVSWEEAQEFIGRLNERSEETGRVYRLPTEAEWEYACRAGTTTRYFFGDNVGNLGEYAWFEDNSDDRPHRVGRSRPNAWGLYDMLGNVWEWCFDWYSADYYANSPLADPTGPESGSSRVYRGGSWNSTARSCRSANRSRSGPGYRSIYLGFRVAFSSVE